MMLLTVLLISGGILSITSITAYLMAQRLHLASDINDSTKAVYAADAGIEWLLYRASKPAEARNHPWSGSSVQELGNGAQFEARSQTLYVIETERQGWHDLRCAECDTTENFRECRDSFTSDRAYPGNRCYDWHCRISGLCRLIPGLRFSVSYVASGGPNITSIGKSGNVVRAFELSP